MTDTVKMPEPVYFTTKNGRLWTFPDEVDQTGLELRIYTEAQLKQYGDDRAREALEMAAKTITATYGGITAVICANLVLKLKEKE